MNEQTAVEWLVNELRHQMHHGALDAVTISKLKLQAKRMEREQTEENMAHAITFGWELSHYHRDKEPEVLLKMQKDFITRVIKGGDK